MTADEMRAELAAADAQRAFEVVAELLMKEARVAIRDFGIFELHRRKARRTRNPRNGDPIEVPAKVVVKFKPAKTLKLRAEQHPRPASGAGA